MLLMLPLLPFSLDDFFFFTPDAAVAADIFTLRCRFFADDDFFHAEIFHYLAA